MITQTNDKENISVVFLNSSDLIDLVKYSFTK